MRNQLERFKIPNPLAIISISYITHKLNTKNGYENVFLLSASDFLCIKIALSSGEQVGVVVNKEYCLDINEIQLSKNLSNSFEFIPSSIDYHDSISKYVTR